MPPTDTAKMVKIGVLALAWISLGVLNFGAMNAQMKYVEQNDFARLGYHQRHELGFIVGESCIVPPAELVSTLIITNFLQHGWTLKSW